MEIHNREVGSSHWGAYCNRASLQAAVKGLQNQGLGVRAALRKLSKDSGIPYPTLRDWLYYKEKKIKRERKPKTWRSAVRYIKLLCGCIDALIEKNEPCSYDDLTSLRDSLRAVDLLLTKKIERYYEG